MFWDISKEPLPEVQEAQAIKPFLGSTVMLLIAVVAFFYSLLILALIATGFSIVPIVLSLLSIGFGIASIAALIGSNTECPL